MPCLLPLPRCMTRKIAVAVMVENGESGSGVAAPVAKQVMDAWLLDGRASSAEFAPPLTAEGKKP